MFENAFLPQWICSFRTSGGINTVATTNSLVLVHFHWIPTHWQLFTEGKVAEEETDKATIRKILWFKLCFCTLPCCTSPRHCRCIAYEKTRDWLPGAEWYCLWGGFCPRGKEVVWPTRETSVLQCLEITDWIHDHWPKFCLYKLYNEFSVTVKV